MFDGHSREHDENNGNLDCIHGLVICCLRDEFAR